MARKQKPTPEEIEERLWTQSITEQTYTAKEKYQAALLEQYKMYVEMADRISARRGLTNTFFLTLNSLVFTTVGVFWKDKPKDIADEVFVLLLVVALAQCLAWWALVRSYQQLNSAKYEVIGLMEKQLPASPYWSAEWKRLGEGKNWRLYIPLSHIERVIPLIFAAVYIAAFVMVIG
jgi:hypothetical protein